ncbi:MAG: hypothetical protein N3D18_03620 [Roseococcus sp.]|nr:hypothetical protein [Roseococcus sp.]
MSEALAWTREGGAAEALALAALVRDCVASGVERHALLLRLSRVPDRLRAPRHARQWEEALAPLLRPTRARRFDLPGGDVAVICPPPGAHLETVRATLERLVPELPIEEWAPHLRLPAEAAVLLTAVEAALGLAAAPEPSPPPPGPPPSPAALDAALRALAGADVAIAQRRRGLWRLAPGQEEARREAVEIRAHLPDLAERLLPGAALEAWPAAFTAFRRAAERRLLADLARPEEARHLGPVCLPLALGSVTEAEALRLDAALGPAGRAALCFCVPLADALADPAGFARARRLAQARGWRLGLDGLEPGHVAALSPAARAPGLLRLRFRPGFLAADAAERAAFAAALPEDRARVALLGADTPAAIAWAWQHGITLFAGRVFEGRA